MFLFVAACFAITIVWEVDHVVLKVLPFFIMLKLHGYGPRVSTVAEFIVEFDFFSHIK